MFIIYLTIKFLWVQCKITSYQNFYVEKKKSTCYLFSKVRTKKKKQT